MLEIVYKNKNATNQKLKLVKFHISWMNVLIKWQQFNIKVFFSNQNISLQKYKINNDLFNDSKIIFFFIFILFDHITFFMVCLWSFKTTVNKKKSHNMMCTWFRLLQRWSNQTFVYMEWPSTFWHIK